MFYYDLTNILQLKNFNFIGIFERIFIPLKVNSLLLETFTKTYRVAKSDLDKLINKTILNCISI